MHQGVLAVVPFGPRTGVSSSGQGPGYDESITLMGLVLPLLEPVVRQLFSSGTVYGAVQSHGL